eukprot:3660594-Amphidinium_carterae.1
MSSRFTNIGPTKRVFWQTAKEDNRFFQVDADVDSFASGDAEPGELDEVALDQALLIRQVEAILEVDSGFRALRFDDADYQHVLNAIEPRQGWLITTMPDMKLCYLRCLEESMRRPSSGVTSKGYGS